MGKNYDDIDKMLKKQNIDDIINVKCDCDEQKIIPHKKIKKITEYDFLYSLDSSSKSSSKSKSSSSSNSNKKKISLISLILKKIKKICKNRIKKLLLVLCIFILIIWVCGTNGINSIRGFYIREKIILISNSIILFISDRYKLIKKIILEQIIKKSKSLMENNLE